MNAPLGEGTAEVSSEAGLGVGGVTGSGNHESAVSALVTQVEEDLSGYLTAEEDKKQRAASTLVQCLGSVTGTRHWMNTPGSEGHESYPRPCGAVCADLVKPRAQSVSWQRFERCSTLPSSLSKERCSY